MAEAERVLIRHKQDRREFSILEKDFDRAKIVRLDAESEQLGSYNEAGFDIIGPDNRPRREPARAATPRNRARASAKVKVPTVTSPPVPTEASETAEGTTSDELGKE